MSDMTPREIVDELNRHIIGQDNAKKAVAVALRNRWRRMQLEDELRQEVTPKNILMIGPTGVGKTEIARRLAKLANAPFIKVEATKFTEVGYVGKEIESIIRDLTDTAVKQTREQMMKKSVSVPKKQRKIGFWMPCYHRPKAGLMRTRPSASKVIPARSSARNCAKASSMTKRLKLIWLCRKWAWRSWRRQVWKK